MRPKVTPGQLAGGSFLPLLTAFMQRGISWASTQRPKLGAFRDGAARIARLYAPIKPA